MTAFQIITASLVTGLCTKVFGWPGFFGSVAGQVLFAVVFL